MKTAVLTVMYPAAREFFDEFFKSLNVQSDNGFTLFLVREGISKKELETRAQGLKVLSVAGKGSPAFLRKKMIREAMKAGFERLIFADIDDVMQSNRIEISKRVLKNADVVFNDIVPFSKKEPERISTHPGVFAARFSEGEDVKEGAILDANCIGFSSAAMRSSAVPATLGSIPDSTLAFDWTFFSHVLHGGRSARFTAETRTYYRRHEKNLAPFGSFTDAEILRGLNVKRRHFEALSDWGQYYISRARLFRGLGARIRKSASFRKSYFDRVRRAAGPASFWWEPILAVEVKGGK